MNTLVIMCSVSYSIEMNKMTDMITILMLLAIGIILYVYSI